MLVCASLASARLVAFPRLFNFCVELGQKAASARESAGVILARRSLLDGLRVSGPPNEVARRHCVRERLRPLRARGRPLVSLSSVRVRTAAAPDLGRLDVSL